MHSRLVIIKTKSRANTFLTSLLLQEKKDGDIVKVLGRGTTVETADGNSVPVDELENGRNGHLEDLEEEEGQFDN